MDLRLSWDLFIIVFFAIVTAYSLIIGRNGTIKVILSTYIAILCSDGIGNLLSGSLTNSAFFQKLMGFFGFTGGIAQAISLFKIAIFIAIIVILTIHGLFEIELAEPPSFIKLSMLIFLAILSGGLIVSTIIVFANSGSLISGQNAISNEFLEIYKQSRLIKTMLDWHDLWFAAPGLALIALSFFQRKTQQ